MDNFEVLACRPKPSDATTTQRQPTTAEVTLGTTTEEPTTLEGQCDNSLLVGSCLLPGSERYSCNGFYRTVFANGQLVTYTTYEPIKAIWSSNTTCGTIACLEPNGQFVIKLPDGTPIWGSDWIDPDNNPSLEKPILIQGDDGSLSVITNDGPMWSTGVSENPPGIYPDPDPFLQPFITPPYYPKNTTEIAGPCGKLQFENFIQILFLTCNFFKELSYLMIQSTEDLKLIILDSQEEFTM